MNEPLVCYSVTKFYSVANECSRLFDKCNIVKFINHIVFHTLFIFGCKYFLEL